MGLFGKRKKQAQDAAPAVETPATPAVDAGPVEIANLQGVGSRAEQQDAFGLSLLSDYEEKGLLAVLCDGMGGMEAGREIAQHCVQQLIEHFPLPATAEEIDAFDGEILRVSNELFALHQGRGGSTLVLCYLREGDLWFKCLGDSDLFLLRGGAIYALNEHQTYGNELLRRSLPEGADVERSLYDPQAGALFRFMGCAEAVVEKNRAPFRLEPDDILLLCSDGVSGTLSRQQLLGFCEGDLSEAAKKIEDAILAVEKPNQDNYTAILCRYRGTSQKNHAAITQEKGGNHETE